jgi:hypothetical protein
MNANIAADFGASAGKGKNECVEDAGKIPRLPLLLWDGAIPG